MFDVSNPQMPVLTSQFILLARGRDVVLSTDSKTAFVTADRTGLLIVDVSNTMVPYTIASLDTQGLLVSFHLVICVQGQAMTLKLSTDEKIATVADGSSGLTIVDVSDKSKPIMLSQV